MSKMTEEEMHKWHQDSLKNWRSWGSWFSWGSPVGLSIFLLTLTGCAWVISKI